MKLFISADIEGCAGVALTDETHKKESVYQRFAEEMTEEVVAACEAAHEAGADEIVVKDGHGDASNIDPLKMPEYVTLIRGKSGHPYNMMYGIDDSYDGVLYLGYHAPAGDPNFSISHTSTGNSLYIPLHGKEMSACRQAKELIPGITTVETKHGVGAATWCKAKEKVISEIREGVKKAVTGQKKECQVALPEHFTYEVTYKDWKKAYTMSFYPGMQKVDTFTNKLETDRWMDIVTAHCFVVY